MLLYCIIVLYNYIALLYCIIVSYLYEFMEMFFISLKQPAQIKMFDIVFNYKVLEWLVTIMEM